MQVGTQSHAFLTRPLGRTGFNATRIGIGDLADRSTPLEQCVATIHRALNYGLNLIDTAPMYEDGYSEQIVGEALKNRREGVFVIDKIDHLDRPVAGQAQASLQRLGMNHVDLLVMHGLSSVTDWEEAAAPGGAMEQLKDCIKAGHCRFRGISSHDPRTLVAALNSGLCDVVMFPIGPYVDKGYIEQVLPLARRFGVGTVCFKTFGAGKLLGDTQGYGRLLQGRPRGKLSSGGIPDPGISPSATEYAEDAPLHPEATPMLPSLNVEDCLHYTLTCDPEVALLGMSFVNELDTAMAAARSFKPLEPERMAELRLQASRAVEGKGACWWNPSATVE